MVGPVPAPTPDRDLCSAASGRNLTASVPVVQQKREYSGGVSAPSGFFFSSHLKCFTVSSDYRGGNIAEMRRVTQEPC